MGIDWNKPRPLETEQDRKRIAKAQAKKRADIWRSPTVKEQLDTVRYWENRLANTIRLKGKLQTGIKRCDEVIPQLAEHVQVAKTILQAITDSVQAQSVEEIAVEAAELYPDDDIARKNYIDGQLLAFQGAADKIAVALTPA